MSRAVVSALHAAKKAFSRVPVSRGFDGAAKPFMIHGEGGFTFLGIHQELQAEAHYGSARKFFSKKLKGSGAAHSSERKFNQLIGDSASFDEEGSTARSSAFYEMFKKMADSGDHWLYGFTAHNEADGRMDANGAVGRYLAEHPEQAERFIGNVVCEHTPMALEKWGCSFAKEVRNFLLVHSEKGARFGDDTIASDNLTNGTVLMGEGGVQSFRQASYMLARGIPVIGVANLRGEKNPATRDPKSGEYLSYFSASGFLNIVKSALGGEKSLSLEEVTEIQKDYFASHVPANPNRPDFLTKQDLLKKAFEQFVGEEVWTKMAGYRACAFDGERIVDADSPRGDVSSSAHEALAGGGPRSRL